MGLENHTIRAIAKETGLPRPAVESAFTRHGVIRPSHATSRARRDERAHAVAARLVFVKTREVGYATSSVARLSPRLRERGHGSWYFAVDSCLTTKFPLMRIVAGNITTIGWLAALFG